MWIPSEYIQALLLLICSMLCWGSWGNALKLMETCRFELFYWDYVFGTTLVSIVLAFTLGSFGSSGPPFLSDLSAATTAGIAYGFAGGAVFNLSNILLTGAIEVAGLAVAFPVGVGLSIVIGVVLNYIITPKNDPILLFTGVLLIIIAILIDAAAFRKHLGDSAKTASSRGILLCIISGVGLGFFYPLVAKSLAEPHPMGPYAIGVVFMLGMLVSNLVVNPLIMRKPITDRPPLPLSAYFEMPARWHMLGLVGGGAVWGLGTILNFAASSSGLVGPATSFALGDGAVLISALWGILVWKEFKGATPQVKNLLLYMVLIFTLGLTLIALSPIVSIG
ncbi:MAG: AcrB/AcrD/AcrF family protein [Acidobacteriota bacterium]